VDHHVVGVDQDPVALAQPFRFYLLSRVQADYVALGPADRNEVDGLLQACGMSEILDMKLSRAMGRKDNLEVWL